MDTNVLAGERGQDRLMQPAPAIQLGNDVPFTLLQVVAEFPGRGAPSAPYGEPLPAWD